MSVIALLFLKPNGAMTEVSCDKLQFDIDCTVGHNLNKLGRIFSTCFLVVLLRRTHTIKIFQLFGHKSSCIRQYGDLGGGILHLILSRSDALLIGMNRSFLLTSTNWVWNTSDNCWRSLSCWMTNWLLTFFLTLCQDQWIPSNGRFALKIIVFVFSHSNCSRSVS